MLEREGREEGAERTGRFGSVVVVGAETTAPHTDKVVAWPPREPGGHRRSHARGPGSGVGAGFGASDDVEGNVGKATMSAPFVAWKCLRRDERRRR